MMRSAYPEHRNGSEVDTEAVLEHRAGNGCGDGLSLSVPGLGESL